jgi:hypothetical protein
MFALELILKFTHQKRFTIDSYKDIYFDLLESHQYQLYAIESIPDFGLSNCRLPQKNSATRQYRLYERTTPTHLYFSLEPKRSMSFLAITSDYMCDTTVTPKLLTTRITTRTDTYAVRHSRLRTNDEILERIDQIIYSYELKNLQTIADDLDMTCALACSYIS